jgi:hypothetical protein
MQRVNTKSISLREFNSRLAKLRDEIVSEMRSAPTGYSWRSLSDGSDQGRLLDGGYLVFSTESPEIAMHNTLPFIQWINEAARRHGFGGSYAIQGLPSETLVMRVYDR